jgi:hypothetical protein
LFNVYVPTPATVTTPSVSHVVVPGVNRQVTLVFKPTPDDARPLAPVKVVNATVPPGITDLVSGVATGTAGSPTVGVIVALVTWPVVSATTYFTGVATPAKVGNGLNVTVPFAFTVYVPSFGTVNDVNVHEAFAVVVVAHNFRLAGTKVAGLVAESFVKGEIN